MQFLSTAVTAALAATLGLSTAAPSQLESRQSGSPEITFEGAGGASYTLSPPFQGQNVTISTSRSSELSHTYLRPYSRSCPLFPPRSLHSPPPNSVQADIVLIHMEIGNPLSVSKITVNVEEGVCSFAGADGSSVFVVGEGSVDVGPPQAQTSVRCCAFSCIGFPQNCCA